jgi:hypothetical protein
LLFIFSLSFVIREFLFTQLFIINITSITAFLAHYFW